MWRLRWDPGYLSQLFKLCTRRALIPMHTILDALIMRGQLVSGEAQRNCKVRRCGAEEVVVQNILAGAGAGSSGQ